MCRLRHHRLDIFVVGQPIADESTSRELELKRDLIASGELLLWCAKRMTLPSEERDRILRAGRELAEGGNPDAALMLLKEGRSEVSNSLS